MRAIEQLEYILNYSDASDTNHRIAEQLMLDLAELRRLSAEEVAQRCNVSNSTLTRFFKVNNFGSYSRFQAELRTALSDYEYRSVYIPPAARNEQTEEAQFLDMLAQNIQRLHTDVPESQLEAACRAMHESKRVIFASNSSMTTLHLTVLRTALALTHKQTVVLQSVNPNVQAEIKLEKDDFVFLMKAESPAAHMLDHFVTEAKQVGCKSLAISNVRGFSGKELIDFPLGFKGVQAYVDSFAMEAIITLLSITYRRLYKNEIRNAGK